MTLHLYLMLSLSLVLNRVYSLNKKALYEMFGRDELKALAQEALGKETSLTEITKMVAKAWKAVKDGGNTGTESRGVADVLPGDSQVSSRVYLSLRRHSGCKACMGSTATVRAAQTAAQPTKTGLPDSQ